MAFADNLSSLGETSWTKQVQLKIPGKTWNKGSFGKRIEWGSLFSRDEDDILLIKKHAVRMASPQWWTGAFAPNNKVPAVSTKCLFSFCYTILLWCVWACELM